MKKIKIAFIKFGGLSAGGTEKFLQTIAVNLDKERFEVDYFYCDTAPYKGSNYKHPGTDAHRKEYMIVNNINLIEFNVGYKDINTYTHDWIKTNFWDKFNEDDYDLIQTGRAGHSEYPFHLIKYTPIVDSIHTLSGVDNQYNISRVMHISTWSSKKWVNMGGDRKRTVQVSHPMQINHTADDLRKKFKIIPNAFIYGFHQRSEDTIFSEYPLLAYKKIENKDNLFILMGGSDLYKKQAEHLDIKNFIQIPHSGDPQAIYSFLQTLDVYSHGRKDGELNSTAIAEALFFKLPIVSHTSPLANGHIECIGNAGKVVDTVEEYADELLKLERDRDYYNEKSHNAENQFLELYELKSQIDHISSIYEDVISNPFPNKIRRIYLNALNTTKMLLFNRVTILIYRKFKKLIYG